MKKKVFVYLLCLSIITAMLSACGSDNTVSKPHLSGTVSEETDSSEDVTVSISEVSTEPVDDPVIETVEIDYDSYYIPVLEALYARCGDNSWELDEYPGDTGVREIGMYEPNKYEVLTYTYLDVNTDDVKELLIVYSDSYGSSDLILAGYTIVNDEVVNFLEGWGRNRYSMLGNGNFYNSGSAGAAYYCFGEYELASGSSELTAVDFYFSDTDDYYNPLYFHNTSGIWEVSEAEPFVGTEEDFYALDEEYISNCVHMYNLTPFSTLGDGTVSQKAEFTLGSAGDVYNHDYSEFELDKSSNQAVVSLFTDTTVSEFEIVALSFDYIDDNGDAYFNTATMYSMDSFKPDHPLLLKFGLIGDMPTYGISYAANGIKYTYALCESGFDGSIFLDEINKQY